MKLFTTIALAIVVLAAVIVLGWYARPEAAPPGQGAPGALQPGAATLESVAQPVQLVPSEGAAAGPERAAAGPVAGSEAGSDDLSVLVTGRVILPEDAAPDPTLEVFALRVPQGYLALAPALDRLGTEHEAPWEKRAKDRALAALLERAPVAADGSFSIAFPAGTRKGFLMLRGRYLYLRESHAVGLAKGPAEVTLHPDLGAWVTGTLRRGEGVESADLAGLAVVLLPDSLDAASATSFGSPTDSLVLGVRARAGGSFGFRGVPTSATYTVAAAPKLLAATRRQGLAPEPGERVELELILEVGGRLAGEVRGPDGGPVAGAKVEASLAGRFFGADDFPARSAETDASGSFELLGVPAGPVKVRADHPAYLQGAKQTVEVPAGGSREGVLLQLTEGNAITGRVTRSDGQPASGVRVDAGFDSAYFASMASFNAFRGAKGVTETDAEGAFRLAGLGGGPFTVTAAEKRAVAEGVEVDWSARIDAVKPGTKGLELVLRPPLGLHGRVLDGDSEPVTEFSVVAERRIAGPFMTMTDARRRQDFRSEEGAFFLENLIEGSWELSVENEGLVTLEPMALELPLETEGDPLVITVQRAATVHGSVVDVAGDPVAGARIEVDSGSSSWMSPPKNDPLLRRAWSEPDGSFVISGLAPGNLGLYAMAEGYARGKTSSMETQPGEVVEDVVLRVTAGGDLTGEVLDDDGQPAGGRMIAMNHMAGFSYMTVTDSSGRFEARHLSPGVWQLMSMNMGADWSSIDDSDMASVFSEMKTSQATLVEGETTHVVIGQPPADPVRVHGKVTLGGEPYAGAIISFYPEGSRLYERLTFCSVDDEGQYELVLDGPGNYVVNIQKMSGGGSQQNTIELTEDVPETEDHRVDFVVPEGRISGRVTGPDGEPAAEARVTLTMGGAVRTDSLFGGQYAEITTDTEGHYDIQGLRAATYRLSVGGAPLYNLGASSDFGRVTLADIELGEDQWLRDVDLRLSSPGTLDVTVVDAAGKPLSQATVFVRDAAGRMVEPFSMLMTDGAGHCEYPGLAPGEFTVTARLGNLACAESAPLSIAQGEETHVRLVLEEGTILWIKIKDAGGEGARATLRVVDGDGREMAGMFGMQDLQVLYLEGAFSPTEHRLGPLPPGKYKVYAEAGGVRASKTVRLRGEPERMLTVRLR